MKTNNFKIPPLLANILLRDQVPYNQLEGLK